MLRKWRLGLGTRRLMRRVKTRNKGYCRLGAFSQVQSVLIVAPAAHARMYESCLRLQERLQSQAGRRVCLVAWRSDRRQLYLQQGRDQYVIEPHEVNWLFKPSDLALAPFTSREFDYVLDFTPTGELPLQWVVTLSRAPMKVGINARSLPLYDMVIDLPRGGEGQEAQGDMVGDAWQALQQWLEGCE